MYVHVCLRVQRQRAKEEGNTFTFKKYDKNSCLVNLQFVVCLPISMRMFKKYFVCSHSPIGLSFFVELISNCLCLRE